MANRLSLMVAQRLSERIIVLQGDDGLGELVEVPSENIGSVVDGVASPVQTLSPARGRVEGHLELFYSFLRARQAEYALDIGRWSQSQLFETK